MTATRITHAPVIDGVLSEPEWSSTPPATGFLQRDPDEGQPASQPTEMRVLYDDEALYFGCMFYDAEPERIVGRLTRRDDEIESDFGSIRIDSYHDHQTCFEFTFNAAGVKTDILQYDDGDREDASWDPVWEVETRITDRGWCAEVKIPFSVLRYTTLPDDSGAVWGINLIRYISRRQENQRWAFTPKNESGFVSRFGHLKGLRSLPPPHRVEIMPFVVQRQQWDPPAAYLSRTSRYSGSGGVDLKVGLSNNFILDATVNPDFGQVEADPAVLNLTTFETFYPEKRPFFVEGTQILRFATFGDAAGPGMFYSRRIGRAISPDEVDVPTGGHIVEMPQNTTILGAAKITGKNNGGLSLGILQAVTRREQALLSNAAGEESPVTLEPLAHYNIMRVKQDVLDGSYLGAIFTSTEKEHHRPAFTGGADWMLRLSRNTYRLSGFLASSSTTGSDGGPLTGSAGKVELARIAAVHWLWLISGDFTSPGYNINDAGFFRRPNDVGSQANLTYRENEPSSAARQYSVSLNLHERWNFNRANIIRQANLQGNWLLPNYWLLEGVTSFDAGLYDDRETRGNGLYRRPRVATGELSVESDERGDVVAEVKQSFGSDSHGRHQFGTGVELRLRPVSWMNWEVEGQYVRVKGQEAWVTNMATGGGLLSIFGDRSTHQYDFTLRGTVTFTRELTLQMYGQIFLARGHYHSFRQLQGVADFTPVQYNGTSDFNEKYLNANVVLRWEYLPGSTLYFVWSHARSGDDGKYTSTLGRNLSDMFLLPSANVVMVKASYWWGM